MKKVCILTGALLCLALPAKSEDTPKASQGYRGFIDFGYNIGTMTYDDANRIELSMSHGYQFKFPLFIGLGVGYNGYTDEHFPEAMTTFADARYTADWLQFGRFAPFVGMKFGIEWLFSPEIWAEFYTQPSLGLKYNFNEKIAAHFSIGYSSTVHTGVALKVGVEF